MEGWSDVALTYYRRVQVIQRLINFSVGTEDSDVNFVGK